MLTGIFAGVTWAVETVLLGIAMSSESFAVNEGASFLIPFAVTFLHDAISAIFIWIMYALKGEIKNIIEVFKTSDFKWLILSSCIGGPIGMTGYVLAVNYLGSSVGAVASAIYPAIGTLLAFFFLKERVKWYQWIFLVCTLIGVYGISYSPILTVTNFWLGLVGALMCAFGWGIEGVILAKCLRSDKIKDGYALCVRQTTSALVYGAFILPLIGGWKFTCGIFSQNKSNVLITIIAAAVFATVSYLLYYKTISRVGAAKAMALNITYTAWAIFFGAIILKDTSALFDPLTLICSVVVVVCGIFSAIDVPALFSKKK